MHVDTATLTLVSGVHTVIDTVHVDTASLTLTEGVVTLIDTIPVETAAIILTAFEIELDSTVDIDTAELDLVAGDVTINEREVVPVDLATLILTPFDAAIGIGDEIVIDTASLTLLPFEIKLNENIIIDTSNLTLTPGVGITAGEIVRMDASDLTLTGNDLLISPFDITSNTIWSADQTVTQEILEDTIVARLQMQVNNDRITVMGGLGLCSEVSASIRAGRTHIYPIFVSPSCEDEFGYLIEALSKFKQDFSLQAWVSADVYGNDMRTKPTNIKSEKELKLISDAFIEQYDLGKQQNYLLLQSIYPGVIYNYKSTDPRLYLHVRNVQGREQDYRISPDKTQLIKYLAHVGLADLETLVC